MAPELASEVIGFALVHWGWITKSSMSGSSVLQCVEPPVSQKKSPD